MARSWLRNRIEFALYLVARRLAYTLGPTPLAWCGARLGELYGGLARGRREILRFNLEMAFPELDRRQRNLLGRRVAAHFGRVALEALRIQRMTPDELKSMVTIQGREHLDSSLALGRGVFLLSAHLGSWEVAALIAGLIIDGGFAVINRPLDNPLLEAELERLRGGYGNRALGRHRVARDVLRQLAAGGAVGILIDQRARREVAAEVPFFGQSVWTHLILARLARRTAAPIVPIWGLWDGPGRYTVRFDEPLLVDQLPEDEQDEVALTARFNRIYEGIIRERPEQWLWYHDRWRELRCCGSMREALTNSSK